ncbi:N-glycosylase/DNA lyase [archaeon]|nr:MAG: N-glycosylase/DNA lyase [archaeon]
MTDELVRKFQSKDAQIRSRLEEFRGMMKESDQRIFAELAFCLCTPQSKATSCWSAVTSLVENGLLFTGTENQIRPFLNAIRFGENKSRYIVQARKIFSGGIKKKLLSMPDPVQLRDWLAENVMGLGLKESSHFLRNVGLSDNKVAILDRHILKNLVKYGVIAEIPKSLTEKRYREIEQKMKDFAQEIGITLDELDLLFWSEETGIVFK